MAKELIPIDISKTPALLRLAQEVNALREPRLLRHDGEDLAVLTPIRKPRVPRGKPTAANDPLWNIVGIGTSQGPTDVSENKYKYLAEAYAPKAL